MRRDNPIAVLLVIIFAPGCTTDDALPITLASAELTDVCRLTRSLRLAAHRPDGLPTSIRGTSLAPDGSIVITDLEARHVYVIDSVGTPVLRFGGAGNGPGEFFAPFHSIRLHDGGFAVADMDQKVHLFDSSGRFRSRFATRQQNPRYIRELSDGRLLVAGPTGLGPKPTFVAEYSRNGERLATWLDVDTVLLSTNQFVSEAFVTPVASDTLVLGAAIVAAIHIRTPSGVTRRALEFPRGVWKQLRRPEQPYRTRKDRIDWVERASMITAAGVSRDGSLVLGVHTGAFMSGVNHVAIVKRDLSTGVIAPLPAGPLISVGPSMTLAVSTLGDSVNALQMWDCGMPNRVPGVAR